MTSYLRQGRWLVSIVVLLCLANVTRAGLLNRRGPRLFVRHYAVHHHHHHHHHHLPTHVQYHKPVRPQTMPAQPVWPIQPQYPVQVRPGTANRPTVAATAPGRTYTALIRYGRSIVSLDNQSGEPALVRLVGPTRSEVYVPNGTRRSVQRVAAGRYLIQVRYGIPGKYRYTRGDSFNVVATSTSYSRVTITLHPVIGGTYSTFPSSAAEFAAAAP
jgi:hypothetical protein